MDCSTPGFPVHHQLPELAEVPWVSDAIQTSHLPSSPSPPAFNLSQHQYLFQWVSSLHQVAKLLEHIVIAYKSTKYIKWNNNTGLAKTKQKRKRNTTKTRWNKGKQIANERFMHKCKYSWRNSRKTTWRPRHRKMKPFPATMSQEKSHVRYWRSKR